MAGVEHRGAINTYQDGDAEQAMRRLRVMMAKEERERIWHLIEMYRVHAVGVMVAPESSKDDEVKAMNAVREELRGLLGFEEVGTITTPPGIPASPDR